MVPSRPHHRQPSSSSADLSLPLPSPAASAPVAPAPRAASVTSGRSHTRRHRHARTHHGGSQAHLPQNEFPYFSHTGDVEIVISTEDGRREKRYLLHRLILSQCSAFFEAGTRIEWNGGGGGGGGLGRIDENATANESVTVGSSSRASSRERRGSYEQTGMGVQRRWRYVLDWENAADDEAPMLVQKENGVASSSIFGGGGGGGEAQSERAPMGRNKQPPPANEGFFRNLTNFSNLNLNSHHSQSSSANGALTDQPGDEILKDYDNLFRTMYQYAPILDSINIATAYTECKALLQLADMYDALEIVGSRVDHHLLRFGARLLKQIAKYPPSYLKLAYLARSRTIFTEAMVHVVGQWPAAAPQLRNQVDQNVMELILDKVDELNEEQEKVEARLWRLTLTTSRGERVTPSNDFLSWLAMSLFRQWLAENTIPPTSGILKNPDTGPDARSRSDSVQQPAPRPENGRDSRRNSSNHIASQRVQQPPPAPPQPQPPGRIYRILGSSSQSAYLDQVELKRFLKLTPDLYTRENLRKFERRIDEIKNLARDAVKPLMRNYLELDLSTFGPNGLGYLTCVRVEEREIPWVE